MTSLFDYISWRGDLDFSVSPLNPVDFMIFSQISYLPFDGIVPAPGEKDGINLGLALEILLDKLNVNDPEQKPVLTFKEDRDLINALLTSTRFRNCYLLGYVNKIDIEKEIQFSALVVYTGYSYIVVYRGTDASFVGWKEDFNMAFLETIPAQLEAVSYLESITGFLKGTLYITGHSKGGNLAVYAASFCSDKVQKKIEEVYSYDAPGFHEKIISSESYNKMKDKIRCYIPQSSIIGLLLERGSDYKVVKSTQVGILQHCLYSWETAYNDLVPAEKLALSSQFVDKTIRDWINTLDNNQREQFIEGVYKILCDSEVKSVHEMERSWLIALGRIVKSMTQIDESTRKITLKAMSSLFQSAKQNLETLFKKDPK